MNPDSNTKAKREHDTAQKAIAATRLKKNAEFNRKVK